MIVRLGKNVAKIEIVINDTDLSLALARGKIN
jgi:hypothetical protein